MSIITCYNCGKQISDKTKQCIHCGAPVVANNVEKEELPMEAVSIPDEPLPIQEKEAPQPKIEIREEKSHPDFEESPKEESLLHKKNEQSDDPRPQGSSRKLLVWVLGGVALAAIIIGVIVMNDGGKEFDGETPVVTTELDEPSEQEGTVPATGAAMSQEVEESEGPRDDIDIIVGYSTEKTEAEKTARQFRNHGYDAYIINRKGLYYVSAGSVRTSTNAESLSEQIKIWYKGHLSIKNWKE